MSSPAVKGLIAGAIVVGAGTYVNDHYIKKEHRYPIDVEYSLISACEYNYEATLSKCICALKRTQKEYPNYIDTYQFRENFKFNYKYCR